ncbi:hypothetical protein NMK34_02165 [Micromonospora sp. BRA006-A]|uniref:hypothetical protein n=1 Tax=Micromonospora sp. BRA006-A TaxID=2962860 RepID=UPI00296E8ED8|nr:hypothetical protein [Micromonospora sp. BRA006-A]MDW3845410.1 hypothetical protein [Micromonospora sp. BRA006-A]
MDDLDDITGGDEKRTQALRELLDQLASSNNPLLREMATAVQDGQLTLREAATSGTYGDELAGPFVTFWNAYQQMTPEERDDLPRG